MDGSCGAGTVSHVVNQGVFVLHSDEEPVEGGCLVVQWLKCYGEIIGEHISGALPQGGCVTRPGVVLHLDNREHSLVVVQVGVDLEAASWIPLDDGVDGPSCARGRVVPVIDGEVDDHARRAFIDKGFELRRQRP